MNDLYGVDPSAPQNARDIADLLRIFSPHEGRFIADFPQEWSKELRRRMREISPLESARFDELWRFKAKHTLLPVRETYKNNIPWAENAVRLKNRCVKLIGPPGAPRNIIEPIDLALCDPDGFPNARDAHIPQTAHAYIDAIEPLLLTSPILVIIDPYFILLEEDDRGKVTADPKNSGFLKALVEAASKYRRIDYIDIHCCIQKKHPRSRITLRDLDNHALSITNSLDAAAISIKHFHLDKKFHDRHILGQATGLNFSHGLIFKGSRDTNFVAWMSPDTLKPLLEKFT